MSLNIVSKDCFEFAVGCHILGYYDEARKRRADGRRSCTSDLEVKLYDWLCMSFLEDPESFFESLDQPDLLNNTMALLEDRDHY